MIQNRIRQRLLLSEILHHLGRKAGTDLARDCQRIRIHKILLYIMRGDDVLAFDLRYVLLEIAQPEMNGDSHFHIAVLFEPVPDYIEMRQIRKYGNHRADGILHTVPALKGNQSAVAAPVPDAPVVFKHMSGYKTLEVVQSFFYILDIILFDQFRAGHNVNAGKGHGIGLLGAQESPVCRFFPILIFLEILRFLVIYPFVIVQDLEQMIFCMQTHDAAVTGAVTLAREKKGNEIENFDFGIQKIQKGLNGNAERNANPPLKSRLREYIKPGREISGNIQKLIGVQGSGQKFSDAVMKVFQYSRLPGCRTSAAQ